MEKKQIPFIITISYFIAFIGIRMAVLIAGSAESEFADAAKHGLTPEVDFYIGRNIILFGYHIHHFYFGIALICIAGWLALVGSEFLKKQHIAFLYGTGLGLFMDEIGLLLTWGDYYSSLTYLISLFLAGILVNIVFFPYFWRSVKENLVSTSPNSFFWKITLYNKNFVRTVDNLSNDTNKTHRASLVFTGVIYIAVGFLILLYPEFVYYWVAGGFFIQGAASLIRAWQNKEDEKEEAEKSKAQNTS
ncbi:hypothetical protein [Natranaerofaba carboxydovora]|uniref:hypothetical protein n=1 Tax=Natranaerofaba carboxydovora TaxID=2742683 RepID=UPI001F13A121|nr:hypothetical protein [Natranaerofaba carboxydovora]UMZ74813.1 hypothetical protein ACONDI_02416 [Natranaerofaba carboxydovora]